MKSVTMLGRTVSTGLVICTGLLASCTVTMPPPPAHPPAPPAPPVLTIKAGLWHNTWKGDAADVDLTPLPDGSLGISITGNPQITDKGAIVSASVEQKSLLPESTLTVHVEATDGAMDIAIAVNTDQYYESPRVTLTPGEIHELEFDLAGADFKSSTTHWRHTGKVNMESTLNSIQLVLYPVARQTRTLRFETVELNEFHEKVHTPPRTVQPLTNLQVQPLTEQPALHGLLEIEALVSAATENPFDPDEITVDALFTSPSGKTFVCPGFLYAPADEEQEMDVWRIRFSPNEVGTWQWRVVVETDQDRLESDGFETPCVDRETRGGIRVSRQDPFYFEFEDGTFFYPIGHNVAWNSLEQYQHQFQKMGRNGENWSRVWIAAWNCEIEWTPRDGLYHDGLGRYELRRAEMLDAIVCAAEENGLYLQLVLHEHCRLSANTNPEWHNNPYNKERGGFLEKPQDFFTDPEARRLARNRLRYIIARWGYSSHIMAWELFNEVDLTDDFRFDRDTPWHAEMVDFVRKTDPHGRMITTSYISTPNASVYSLPGIDYVMSHVYIEDCITHFTYINPIYATFGKPHFIAEFGRHTDDGVDAQDITGRFLHAGIWSQFLQPAGGNAMSWWWYDLIEPRNLYYHFAALARFSKGLDRRGRDWTLATGLLESGCGRTLALCAPDLVLMWMYNPDILPWSENVPPTMPSFNGLIRFTDVANGLWVVEEWDPYVGRIRSTLSLEATDGTLEIPVVAPGPDVAYKLRFEGEPQDGWPTPRPILGEWDPRQPTVVVERKPFSIPRITHPMPVDGKPDKWSGIPMHTVMPSGGPTPPDQGFGFRFAVAHDTSNLYVIAFVIDQELVRRHGPGGSLWEDDCIELWIDSRFDADYFNNMPHNPGCWQIVIAPALDPDGTPDHTVYRQPEWNDREYPYLEAVSHLTKDGYIIEARLPLDKLRGSVEPKNPDTIGFNISACDTRIDRGEVKRRALLWQGVNEWDAREWGVGKME